MICVDKDKLVKLMESKVGNACNRQCKFFQDDIILVCTLFMREPDCVRGNTTYRLPECKELFIEEIETKEELKC